MKYKAYPNHKKIESLYLPQVPDDWKPLRLRFIIESNPIKSEIGTLPMGTMVSFVPMEAVSETGHMSLEKEKNLGEVYNGYTYFKDGDVVLAKITPCFENGKGAIASNLTNGIGFGTTEFHVLRKIQETDNCWLFYLTKSDTFRKFGESEMYGAGGQKRVPESFIKNFIVGFPPLKVQKQIAEFLDYKTAQIDRLIEKKQQLIEKLNEKRIAVITQAVTKGLDPSVPMKDSGVDWLGEVPEHWQIMKMSHIVRLKSGESITSMDINPTGTYQVFGGNGIRGYCEHYTHNGDYVLIGRQGALCGNVNYAFGRFWASEHAIVVTPDRLLDTIWLGELLRIMNLGQYSVSAAQPGIGVEQISKLKMPYPQKDEQFEISEYIKKENQKVESLIDVMQATIMKLSEYRTALITAAVTGKIDIRNVTIPDQETVSCGD